MAQELPVTVQKKYDCRIENVFLPEKKRINHGWTMRDALSFLSDGTAGIQ
jgi:hypothetical protein